MIHAINQYGQMLVLEGKHPRKELLEATGAGSCQRIYRDKRNGPTVHVGYIVRGEWWTFYTVTAWEQAA
jgi:hypothetical protein